MPVEDHDVDKKTKQGPDARWGCWNLERTRRDLQVKSGFYPDGRQRFVTIPDFGSLGCKNDISLSDKKCTGCKWAGSGEENSLRIRLAAEKAEKEKQ